MACTVIRNADWVVAWDGPVGTGRHVFRRNCDVAWRDGTLVHVGPGYQAPADAVVIDGRGRMLMPGLINLHNHPATEPSFRGVREDHGKPEHYMSGLYDRMQAMVLSSRGKHAALSVAYAEKLTSGTTTTMDLTGAFPGWVELVAESGIRAYLAPGFASARWVLDPARPHILGYDWNEAAGEKGFADACALLEEIDCHPSGLLRGVVFPGQIDTCTEALLRKAAEFARATGRLFTTHIAQSVVEFHEMARRHGITPIQWAHRIGLMAPNAVFAHCIFLDHHDWLRWHTRADLGLLADTGTAVAHCPTPFARYGQSMQDVGRYIGAGVKLGLGTDVAPHNLIEEMRTALFVGRVTAGDIRSIDTAGIFTAATVGGARALGREDLGRLVPGAQADLVSVDLAHPMMRPVRDPLRSLVFGASDRAVRDVFVAGRQVVRDGRALGLDRDAAHDILAEEQARMMADCARRDYLGRSGDQITPMSLPVV